MGWPPILSMPGRRPPLHVEPHQTAEELAARIRREPRARLARRLAAVRPALLGQPPGQVGPQALPSARRVRTWTSRCNAVGADGPLGRAGRGRKGPLAAEQRQRLEGRLQAGPTPAGGACSLRGGDARRVLEKEFGVPRRLQAVYGPLRRLGFAPSRPRPRHPKGGAARRGEFKKSCPRPSPRPRRHTQGRRSRPGSRARPASARRGR